MEQSQRWRVVLDFGVDFPMLRADSIYLRMIKTCWQQLPSHHPHITCSTLQLRSDGVRGYLYGDDVREATAALDAFRHRTTAVIRRLRGQPQAIIWDYVQFVAE
jgi:hypothetical protein